MPALKLRQDIVRTIAYAGANGKQQCVYWDEALEYFGLRVYPSGRRVYVCSYRVNQRKRLTTLGRADVLSLDQARKKAIANSIISADIEAIHSEVGAQHPYAANDILGRLGRGNSVHRTHEKR